MTNTRKQFENHGELRPALGWDSDDGTLSGGERALAASLQVLVEHFDRLDGNYQQAIAATLAEVADETVALESQAREILARARAGRAEQGTNRGEEAER